MTLASVRQLPGIIEVQGSMTTNTLVATYDPAQVVQEQIVEAIEVTGFSVEGVFQP